jgi:Protein of unknown function (DUF1214)
VTDDLARWHEFVTRLDELGRTVTAPPFPADPASDLEGLRHLALQAVCWMEWSLGHQDPRAPMFQRQNDLVLQWGGPNADNVYRHARVHPSLTYRIVGRMHSCDDFILAIRRNFMHMPDNGTIAELSAHELGLGPGDDFEILLGGEGDEPHRVPLPEGALSVSIREYYFDWQPREPATFTIECLDADGAAAPFTSADFAFGLDEAAMHLHRSLTYWNQYMVDARAAQTDNVFAGAYDVQRGLAAAKYAFCFFDLAPDEALVVESDVPDSRYWSFHLYSLAWWEALEYATRVTTRNHTQTRISDDGHIRVVVAHEDPGVANWLDTEGRREALLTLRWFWPLGGPPSPVARVVKLADVPAALPADEPAVTPEQRRDELRARRDHLAWRFRT